MHIKPQPLPPSQLPPPLLPSSPPTHSSLLLVLSIEECIIAELKVALPVLQAAGHRAAMDLLEQPAMVQDQVVNVAPIFDTCLFPHWSKQDKETNNNKLSRE